MTDEQLDAVLGRIERIDAREYAHVEYGILEDASAALRDLIARLDLAIARLWSAVGYYAVVETPQALHTTVTWTGDFRTLLASGVPGDVVVRHGRLVANAVNHRTMLLRILIAATRTLIAISAVAAGGPMWAWAAVRAGRELLEALNEASNRAEARGKL